LHLREQDAKRSTDCEADFGSDPRGNRLKYVLCLLTGVFALSSMPAQATTEYFTHYDVTLNGGQSDVTNMMLLETQNGLTWSFSTNCGGGGGCTTEIDNPFGSTNAPTTALLLGLTNNGQDVVLITDPTFAAGATGQDWSSLFPNTDEPTFLSDIQLATSGGPFCPAPPGATQPCIDPGLDAVFNFGSGDGAGAYFGIGGPMTVMEFSDGVQIGTGTSWVTTEDIPSSTPEPSSLWLLGSGLLGMAGMARRKFGTRS
jgi:hypothetical protein